MIEFSSVTKEYHYDRYAVFENLSFVIETDKTTTLLIETQSGKTTIAKILTGVEKPTGGEIFLEGAPLEDIPLKDRGVAYFPAKPLLFENRSVFFNLAYPLRIREISKDEILKLVSETAEKRGFDLKQKVKKLNEREKYELCAARAALRKPRLLILDDFPKDFFYILEFLPKTTTLVLTSKIEDSLGKIIVIKDNVAAETGTKEKTEEYLKNTVWLTGEF